MIELLRFSFIEILVSKTFFGVIVLGQIFLGAQNF